MRCEVIKIENGNPAIKRSERARRLYPDLDQATAITKLFAKKAGKAYRKILPEEEEQIKLIWKQIKEEIEC